LGRITNTDSGYKLNQLAQNACEILSSESELVRKFFFKEEKFECLTRDESIQENLEKNNLHDDTEIRKSARNDIFVMESKIKS
jgi:hypothetical protein